MGPLRPVIGSRGVYVAGVEPVVHHPEGALVRVLVVPGASRSEIKGRHGDSIRVRVGAPAERGRANRAVCELLEGACGGRAEVLAGSTSRSKTILVRGVGERDVAAALLGD